jgi:hypothetical protein
MEKPLIWKKVIDEKIKKIEIMEDTRCLLVQSEYAVRAYKVRRGLKTHDMAGH